MSLRFNVEPSLADHYEAINSRNTSLHDWGYVVSSNRMNMVLYGQPGRVYSDELVRILGDDMLVNADSFGLSRSLEEFRSRLTSYFLQKRRQLEGHQLYDCQCSGSGIVRTDSGFLMAFSFGNTSIYGRNVSNSVCFQLTQKQSLYNRYAAHEFAHISTMPSFNPKAAVNLFGPQMNENFLSQVFVIPKGVFNSYLLCSHTFDKALSDINLRSGFLQMFEEAQARSEHDPITALFIKDSIFSQSLAYPSISLQAAAAPMVYSMPDSGDGSKIIYSNGLALIPPKEVSIGGKISHPAEILASPKSLDEAGTQLIPLMNFSREGIKEVLDDSVSGEMHVREMYFDKLLDYALGETASFEVANLRNGNNSVSSAVDEPDTDEF